MKKFLAILPALALMLAPLPAAAGNGHGHEYSRPARIVVVKGPKEYRKGPKHKETERHHKVVYHYYPARNVYYVPARRVYYYPSDGHWRMSAHLPANIYVRLGEEVTLTLETERPWIYNRYHVEKYPPGQYKKARVIKEKHVYYYYPKRNVYYQPARNVYFYLSGGNWEVAARLPSDLSVGIGDHVSMSLDTPEPFAYNHEHRERYYHD